MIKKTTIVYSDIFDPFFNLALEECLLSVVENEECILYLWQNKDTVVIGKNQNAWAQCNVAVLDADGGKLARRLSGGGAVFHDVGNLNFTFILKNEDYDVQKQLDVIVEAVRMFGIDARKTGRNDIAVDEKKFSGNAFYKGGSSSYHHGTLLISSKLDALPKYLNVSAKKLESKGVDSVRSRVVNLSQLASDITVESMKKALEETFGQVYGCTPILMENERIDKAKVEELHKKYSSVDWRLGQNKKFAYAFGERFTWGETEICFDIYNAKISECKIYSDALDVEIIERLQNELCGVDFNMKAVIAAVERVKQTGNSSVSDDIIKFLLKQNI